MASGGAGSMAMPILGGIAGFALGGPLGAFAGASAGSAIGGGMQQMQAADAGSQQVKVQQDAEKAQAAQRAAEVRRQLAQTLGTQQAILASRGISDYSAGSTPAAMGADSIYAAGRDLNTNKFNLDQQLAKDDYARQQFGLQKSAAITNMIGGLASTGMSYAAWKGRIGGPGSTPALGNYDRPLLSLKGPGGMLGGGV